jgi:hypothetical protein
MDVDLAQPEFDGLWDKQAVKQEIDPLFNRSKHWKTKMDKVIFNKNPKKEFLFLKRKFYNELYQNYEKILFVNKWLEQNVLKELFHLKVIHQKFILKFV